MENDVIQKIGVIAAALIAFASTANAEEAYVVKRGNNLIWIAAQYGVAREAMIIANQAYLESKYPDRCGHLSNEFRNRVINAGPLKGGFHYCNDKLYRAYANTIRAGDKLVIPAKVAPTSVELTVSDIKGNNVALVIDDTGSMSNKRRDVAQFYIAALKKHGKIGRIYLYADGKVRRVEVSGLRDISEVLQTRGDFENT